MKIYTKLVIDMTTDEILEQESFEYNGPVAQCGSSGGGGGGSQPANTTNVQTIREAPEIEARRLGLIDQAAITASQPIGLPAFQVAQLSQAERGAGALAQQTGAGISSIQGAQRSAAGAVSASQLDPSSAQFQRFLNPYNQFVLDEINRQSQQAQNQLQAKSVAEGAFGGGRQAIAAGEFERARLGKIGEAQFAGFGQALQGFQANQALQAQTGLSTNRITSWTITRSSTNSRHTKFNGNRWNTKSSRTSHSRSTETNRRSSSNRSISKIIFSIRHSKGCTFFSTNCITRFCTTNISSWSSGWNRYCSLFSL